MKRNPKIKTPRRDNELALVLEQFVRDKFAQISNPEEFSGSAFVRDLERAVFTALGNNSKARTMLGYLMGVK